MGEFEEGRVRFSMVVPGTYAVQTNCCSGELEFVGTVTLFYGRSASNRKWVSAYPNGKVCHGAATRKESAARLFA